MPRIIKSGLIQMSLPISEGEGSIEEIMEAMVAKHIPYIEEAGRKGVQILCLQEIFNTPYFCPGQDAKWYASAESIPGPTTERMAEYAKKYQMVMIVPIFEKEQAGVHSAAATPGMRLIRYAGGYCIPNRHFDLRTMHNCRRADYRQSLPIDCNAFRFRYLKLQIRKPFQGTRFQ